MISKHKYSINKFPNPSILLRKKRNQQLLQLQQYYTIKISQTQDENLIRFYLQQTQKIGEQRLRIWKGKN